MTIALKPLEVNQTPDLTREKIDLIRQTVARGTTDLEFQLFLHACTRTGLDPLMKQIHAIKRWDSKLNRETMAIQTGIDGYRLIADRTHCYVPGPKASYVVADDGTLISATAYVKKRTDDGVWHLIEGEAFWEDYAQLTKEGKVTSMWKKGRMMLAKCAEALALRKAFPAELSGIYTHEEMAQAGPVMAEIEAARPKPPEPEPPPDEPMEAPEPTEPEEPDPELPLAASALAQLVDARVEQLRGMPKGGQKLLEIWKHYKLGGDTFAKKVKPSTLLVEPDLAYLGVDVEKAIAQLESQQKKG